MGLGLGGPVAAEQVKTDCPPLLVEARPKRMGRRPVMRAAREGVQMACGVYLP